MAGVHCGHQRHRPGGCACRSHPRRCHSDIPYVPPVASCTPRKYDSFARRVDLTEFRLAMTMS